MYDGWVVIKETSFIQAAEITKGMLEGHGIPCFIMNLQNSAYPQIGDIQLMVSPENVIKAKYLIAKSAEEEE